MTAQVGSLRWILGVGRLAINSGAIIAAPCARGHTGSVCTAAVSEYIPHALILWEGLVCALERAHVSRDHACMQCGSGACPSLSLAAVQDSEAVQRLPADTLDGTRDLSQRAPPSQPAPASASTQSGIFSGRPSSSLPRTILENPDEEVRATQRLATSRSLSDSLHGGIAVASRPSPAHHHASPPLTQSHSFLSNASAIASPRRSSPKLLAPLPLQNGSGSVSTGAPAATVWLSASSRVGRGHRSPSHHTSSLALSMASDETATAAATSPATTTTSKSGPKNPSFRSATLSSTSGTDTVPLPAFPPAAASHVEHRPAAHPPRHIFTPPGMSPRSVGTTATFSPRHMRPPNSADAPHSLGMLSAASHYSSDSLPLGTRPPGRPSTDRFDLSTPAPQHPIMSDASTTQEGGTIDSLSWERHSKEWPDRVVFAPMSVPTSTASSVGLQAGHSWPHLHSDGAGGDSAALHGSCEGGSGGHSSGPGSNSIGNPEGHDRLMASYGSTGSATEATARRLPPPLDPECAAAAASAAAASAGVALDVFWDSCASWGYEYRDQRGGDSRCGAAEGATSTGSADHCGPIASAAALDSTAEHTMSSVYRTTPMPASEGQASASTAAAPSFVDFLLEDPIQSDVAAAVDAEAPPTLSVTSPAVSAFSPAAVVAAAGARSNPSASTSSTAPDLHPQLSARRVSGTEVWDAAELLSSDANCLLDPTFGSTMSSVTTNALFVSPSSRDGDFLLDSASGELRPATVFSAAPPSAAPSSAAAEHPDELSSSAAGQCASAAHTDAASTGSGAVSFHSAVSRAGGAGAPAAEADPPDTASEQTLSFFTAASTAASTAANTAALSGSVTLGPTLPPAASPGNGSAALETHDSIISSSFLSAASNPATAAHDTSSHPAPGSSSARLAPARHIRLVPGNIPLPPPRPMPVPLPLLLELDDSDDTTGSRDASSGLRARRAPGGDRSYSTTSGALPQSSDGMEAALESSVSEGAGSRSSFGDPMLAAPPTGLFARPTPGS